MRDRAGAVRRPSGRQAEAGREASGLHGEAGWEGDAEVVGARLGRLDKLINRLITFQKERGIKHTSPLGQHCPSTRQNESPGQ